MSNASKYRKKAVEYEQLKQFDRAVASYVRAIEENENANEEVDVALFNKVGDLTLRQGRVTEAVTYYERAVEHYVSNSLYDNAIALCNKILRNAPGRSNVYFTLGRICGRKGLRTDATRNFLEYATRMQREGRVDEGMRALAEVADLMPELTEVRRLVEEHAERAGITLAPRRRATPARSATSVDAEPTHSFGLSRNLVFLEIDYDAVKAAREKTPPPQRSIQPEPIPGASAAAEAHARINVPTPPEPLKRTARLEDLMIFDPTCAEEPLAESVSEAMVVDGSSILKPFVDLTAPVEALVDLEPTELTAIPAQNETAETSAPIAELLQHEMSASAANRADRAELLVVATKVITVPNFPAIPEPNDLVPLESEMSVATEVLVATSAAASSETSDADIDGVDTTVDAMSAEPMLSKATLVDTMLVDTTLVDTTLVDTTLVDTTLVDAPVPESADVSAANDSANLPSESVDVPVEVVTEAIEEDLSEEVFSNDGMVAVDAVVEVTDAVAECTTANDAGSAANEIVGEDDVVENVEAGVIENVELIDAEQLALADVPQAALEDVEHVALEDVQQEAAVNDLEDITAPGIDISVLPFVEDAAATVDIELPELVLEHEAVGTLDFIPESAAEEPFEIVNFDDPALNLDLSSMPLDGLTAEDEPSVANDFDISDTIGIIAEEVADDVAPEAGATLEANLLPSIDFDAMLELAETEVAPVADLQVEEFPIDDDEFVAAEFVEEAPAVADNDNEALLEFEDAFESSEELPPLIFPMPAGVVTPELAVDAEHALPLAIDDVDELILDDDAAFESEAIELATSTELEFLDVPDIDASALTPIDLGVLETPADTVDRSLDQLEDALLPVDDLDDLFGATGVHTAVVAAEATLVASTRCSELRAASAAEPDNFGLRRRLAEALFEASDRDDAITELTAALASAELAGALSDAAEMSDQLVLVAGDEITHHQKRLELAIRLGDQNRLRDAYLDLGDNLVRRGEDLRAKAVYARVLEIDPWDDRALAALGDAAPPPPARPPVAGSDEGHVSLADWLRDDEEPTSTRLRMREPDITGDEQDDFNALLKHFKEGVARSLGEDDHESHYDLGVAYKEMGLLDDAIGEFQMALRSRSNRLAAYEALGQCFIEQESYKVAVTVLSRALHEPAIQDEQRVGVLYLLGISCEVLQRFDEARSYFQRVYATDIHFRDVGQRLADLERTVR